jgi:predicted transcriptional regulator of viral defense system
MNISEYIKYLQSIEEYAFSLEELIINCNKTAISLKRELAKLVEKKEIINIRKEFYLIIPPRYTKQQKLPIQLYIEKLLKNIGKAYYLGLYTAAKFHGANHQQAQQEYIITEKTALRDISKGTVNIRFFTSSVMPTKNIIEKKSDAGLFKISSPALTAIDLIHYQTKLGGLNRMLAVIEELYEEITLQDINELLSWYTNKSGIQRMGFLLEYLQADKEIIDAIKKYLENKKYYPVLLSPKTNTKPGAVNNCWKVDINIKLENDL